MSTSADWLPEETIIPELPNEVALLCLARVPMKYRSVLAAVSKPIRSTVSSPEFLAVRSNLNCSEEVLYLLARSHIDTVPEIFALHRNRVAPVPALPEPRLICAASASVGHRIYVIGGWTYDDHSEATSAVWVLDCRSGAWSRGPDMARPRGGSAYASVVGGKIFVLGGMEEPAGPFAEVLDPAAAGAAAWEAVPDPPGYSAADLFEEDAEQSLAMGGKVHIWFDSAVELSLDAATLTWEVRRGSLDRFLKFIHGYPAEDGMKERIQWRRMAMTGWKVVRAGGRPVLMAGSDEKMSVFCKELTVDIEKKKKSFDQPWCTVVKVIKDAEEEEERVFWSKKIDDSQLPAYHWGSNVHEWNCFSVFL